ncbi:G5P family DNA-binding protein [Shewanella mesophila]|uniref:single-stranded DNA-binding protein n=1 Tax=Shewanella mesophila TaxID=2864208 RepID=UPI001C6559EE|nr:single-stranded DNA-binding protein [Shewanella mesophila]QYJ87853.1 G5P family DNA-binding protein [Shewanella mesophila]QYJ87861.1 G5P family DNA-binding protein [Shewanella mesophila]QYJ87869.1 G5P family DNA-binding protein [Shewanella mesophila]
MSVKIEIDSQDCVVQQRSFKGQDGKPDRTIYWQRGYMYNGGRYPVEVQIPLEEGVPPNPAGEYEIHPSSFQVSRFGKIEVNPFNVLLTPLKAGIKAA